MDPRVLQAVLVTAAAANLVNTEGDTQLGELAEFEEAEDFSLEPSQSSQSGAALQHKLGGAFSLPSPSQSGLGLGLGQAGSQGKLGSAFSDVESPGLEFPQQNTINIFSGRGTNFPNLPQAPQFSSPDRKTFGTAFNLKQGQTSIIGPQQAQPALNTDVELISQECHHL